MSLKQTGKLSSKKGEEHDVVSNKNASEPFPFLTQLVNALPEAVITTDIETHITGWNAAAERMYGWKAAEVLDKPIEDFLHTQYQNTDQEEAVATVMENGQWFNSVTQLRKDGVRIPVISSVSVIKNNQGEPVGYVGINRDFTREARAIETSRQQAEELVHESQSTFATASAVAKVGSWRWDLATQKVTWSDQMFRLFGVEKEGFDGDLNRVIAERIHPDDMAAVNEANRSVLEEADPKPLSYRIVLPDGKERTVWAQGVLIRDEQGKPIALTGYVQDITERARAEAQLQQMKRLYATLSQVNQTIVRVKDESELYQPICDMVVKFGEFSLAWVGLLDESTGEIKPTASNGMDLDQWILPIINIHSKEFRNTLVARAIHTGMVMTSEDVKNDPRMAAMREPIKDLPYHASAVVPFKRGEKVVGILAIASPLAGFFKAEEEHALLEEMGMDISFALDKMESDRIKRQWADAFEHSAHGMVIGDVRTNRILACNEAFARDQSASISELIGMPILDLYRPEDHARIKQLIAQSDREGTVQFEGVKLRKDGSIYPFQLDVVSVRNENGNLLYRVASQQDITERKKAEETIRESHERLKKVLEVETVGVMFWDLTTGCLTDANDTFLNLMGYSRRDLEERELTWQKLTPPEYVEVSLAEVGKFYESGRVGPYEKEYFRKDGSRLWLIFAGSSLGGDACVEFCVDISALKRAEENLRLENERFLRFTNSNITGIVIAETSGKIVFANDYYLDLLGVSRADFEAGRVDWREFTPLEWAAADEKALRELEERGVCEPYEKEYVRADGSRVAVYIADAMLPNGQIAAFILDITERKRSEEALKESEERFSTAFHTNPVSQSIMTLETNEIMAVNDACCNLFGYSREELIGARAADLHLWANPVEEMSAVEEFLRMGRMLAREATIRTKSGETRTIIAEITPISWRGVPCLITSSFDITERKLAETALHTSEERMRLTLQTTSDGFWIVDTNGRFKEINNAYCNMSGYSREELLSMGIPDVEALETRNEIRGRIERIQARGYDRFETRHRRKDGSLFDVEVSVNLLENSGLLICFCRDITERKLTEQEIKQRNKDLTIITALNDAANREEELESVIQTFAQATSDMFGARNTALYLLSHDEQYLDMYSSTLSKNMVERIERLLGTRIPKVRIRLSDSPFLRELLANRNGSITTSPQDIEQWILEFAKNTSMPAALSVLAKKLIPQIYRIINIRSIITVPMLSSGRTIGMVGMSSDQEFKQEDLERVRKIIQQITTVIQRKRAETNVRRQLQRITALNEIDRAISSSLDMKFSLDVLLGEVISQLDVDAASILLLNPVDHTLEFKEGRGFYSPAIHHSHMQLGQGFAGQAGLERKVVHVPNLEEAGPLFIRAKLLKDEKFVEYFGVPLIAKGVLKGVLEIFNRSPLNPDPNWRHFLETLGGQAAIAVDNAQMFEAMQHSNQELIAAYDATITGWSLAMDLRDKETEGHTQRVTELTLKLAERMGISHQEQVHIKRGALLHDIGKLGIPDHILLKPGKLTDEEWDLMRQHPEYAYTMLLPIHYLRPALDIPYCHHEKWDGTGYPRGLKGEEIPLSARIFAVVDVWDALRSDRPYRAGWAAEKVREHIRSESGKHFDPQVVQAFKALLDEYPDIMQ